MPAGGGGDPLHRVAPNSFSDSVTRNHPSVLGINERADKPKAPYVNYDRRQDMADDESDISKLVEDLDVFSRESSVCADCVSCLYKLN